MHANLASVQEMQLLLAVRSSLRVVPRVAIASQPNWHKSFACTVIEAMGIPASSRLCKQRDFHDIRSSCHRIHCGPFVVQYISAVRLGPPRLGLIASRRVGKAVKRNYGRRIFRELFRQHSSNIPSGINLVIVLRSSFDRYKYADLELRLIRAFRTINEMNKTGEAKLPN